MTESPDTRTAERWSTWLVRAGCAAWLIALALPGFTVDTAGKPMHGLTILWSGLLFGWVVRGWAVYANVFFAVAALALLAGRQPRLSVWAMLTLASTLPFFQGVIHDEGSSVAAPVLSWGWGALLWIAALCLVAAAAAVRSRVLAVGGAKTFLGTLGLGAVAFAGLHGYQRSVANVQERALYLPAGMAFTLAPPCGYPLTIAAAPRLAPDEFIAPDIDPALTAPGRTPKLALPSFARYQQDDGAWIAYQASRSQRATIAVRYPASAARPVLQARKTADGAVLRLLAHPAGPVLYEQKLKAREGGAYCPLAAVSGTADRALGYLAQLERATGQRAAGQQAAAPGPAERLAPEVARTACEPGSEDEEGIDGLRRWDGRQVILRPPALRARSGFCSDSYVVLASVDQHAASKSGGAAGASPVALVFDRKTLRPLATFDDGRFCPTQSCKQAPRGLVTGVRVNDQELIVETSAGDLRAARRKGD